MHRPFLAILPLLLLAGCGTAPAPVVTAEERAFGAEQHPRLLAEFGGAYRAEEAAYVARVGETVAAAAGLPGVCTFTLINSDVVNAFAVPGCYLYVTRGMLALVGSEAELASVLGHELGHVVARHAQRQERRTVWRTVGVAVVSLFGSERLTRLAGQAAQYFTLRYSRGQEYQADDLGVRYLRDAGYDPYAAADMLGALVRQERFVADTGGRDEARAIPEWALSHPLTARRVERSRERAVATGLADDALPERAGPYLAEADGLLWGDDPEQGFVIGRRFAHPLMRIGFEAPAGFTLTNSPRAIGLAGPGGVRGEFGGGELTPDGLRGYAEALAGAIAGDLPVAVEGAEEAVVNGLPALLARLRIESGRGAATLYVAAYDGGGGRAFHFVVTAPGDADAGAVRALFASFHPLSRAELAELRPRVLHVVRAGAGDTAATLAARMADPNGAALLRLLNDRGVRPGEPVKIVEWMR